MATKPKNYPVHIALIGVDANGRYCVATAISETGWIPMNAKDVGARGVSLVTEIRFTMNEHGHTLTQPAPELLDPQKATP